MLLVESNALGALVLSACFVVDAILRLVARVRFAADVAQLVEHHLAKVRVAGSSPVIRSGDWRSGSALPSHGRGHWFDPSIAHASGGSYTELAVGHRVRMWLSW